MTNRYQSVLRRDCRLESAVENLKSEYHSDLEQIAANVIAPVLNAYVRWILQEAEKRGISKLLFLARDGWIPFQILENIRKQEHIAIPCDYFFCSRFSLRMATYWMHDNDAYEKLFLRAYRVSAKNLLKRADFSARERSFVYHEIKFHPEREDERMSRAEFSVFCDSVRQSDCFQEILYRKSHAAYAETAEYFRQNLAENFSKIGIVDIGWTGSLQASFKRILESVGVQSSVTGFYVGLLEPPPVRNGSEYAPWLFSWRDNFLKAWFSHNLMECVCSAPHGMTIGYQREGKRIRPVFAPSENNPSYSERIRNVCVEFSSASPFVYQPEHRKIALRLLKNLMFRPSEREAAAFLKYRFCDDTAEQYHDALVRAASPREFRKALFPCILSNPDAANAFYWYYGSLQVSRMRCKTFYRYSHLLTRFLILQWKRIISPNTTLNGRCDRANSHSYRYHVRL